MHFNQQHYEPREASQSSAFSFNLDAVKNNHSLSSHVSQHLTKVYSTLCVTILASAIGALADIQYNIGGLITTLITFGCIIALGATSYQMNTNVPDTKSLATRFSLLLSIGFFQGCSLGDLLMSVAYIDPRIITTAFLGTSAVFICFSLVAFFCEKRSMLFLGGILSSALTLLVIGGFINMFLQSMFIFNIQLYGGLLLMCGFVVFDTQLIVEKAERGDRDFIGHALSFFLDFINIFVRLLIILSKDKKKDERKRR
eukprot:TRINITY_DN1613_c0_g1_i1.p1 TRINITY_DN1613_c0_g1~~TRINITY_DN1613_c0_g1_i1.p1  ORF type:complete len:256 (+),score=102.49 TRINITY_DN1613_c0_g1_i1:23-790(+)